MTANKKLLPCPFCCGEAKFGWSAGVMLAECKECGTYKGFSAEPPDDCKDRSAWFKDGAAKNWNRRPVTSIEQEQPVGQESSILNMETPRDQLRWALAALDLVRNGLTNRRGMECTDVELVNLAVARGSVDTALRMIRFAIVEQAPRTEAYFQELLADAGREEPMPWQSIARLMFVHAKNIESKLAIGTEP